MKKITTTLSLILFATLLIGLSSCSNKPVIEKLTPEEVSKYISKDTLYKNVIASTELLRNRLDNDILLQAKYKDLTYKDLYIFLKTVSDTSFINPIKKLSDKQYSAYMDSVISIYSAEILDSLSYFRNLRDNHSPDNYFKIKLHSFSTSYYGSYNRYVDDVSIKFTITTLKGPIQGGSFGFSVKSKATGREIYDGGSRFSRGVNKSRTFSWEIDYSGKDEFAGETATSFHSKYDIEYNILTARANDTLYQSPILSMPILYHMYLDSTNISKSSYSLFISSHFDQDLKYESSFYNDLYDVNSKKENELAYDFLNEKWN